DRPLGWSNWCLHRHRTRVTHALNHEQHGSWDSVLPDQRQVPQAALSQSLSGIFHVSRYLSYFSRFPSMSNSCFSPPNSADPLPLNLSPAKVSLYSTVISLSMSFRTTEKVTLSSVSLTSLSFVSF